jgi:hypothetical protein
MKEIPLTQGKVALVDDRDYDALMSIGPWQAFKTSAGFYAARDLRESRTGRLRRFFMHAVLLGTVATSKWVDHVNGDTLDNRRTNIRRATPAQNAANRRKMAGSGCKYRGVSWDKVRKKFKATITPLGKQRHLGYYLAEEDAARAYDRAAVEAYGEFAKLNFPRN